MICLDNSRATKPPRTWANTYGTKSPIFNLPFLHIITLTAGLKCPPETLPPTIITAANAKAIGIANFDDSIEESNKKLLDELKQLNLDLKVPTLKEFGVKKEKYFQSIDTMATQAIASGSPNNNPKVPSQDELVSLYKNLWT